MIGFRYRWTHMFNKVIGYSCFFAWLFSFFPYFFFSPSFFFFFGNGLILKHRLSAWW